MSEIRNEIYPETSKVFRTKFTYKIDNFLHKLNQVSRFDFEIAGLAKCFLEVHPNQKRSSQLSSKCTNLYFGIGPPKTPSLKPRKVRFEIRATKNIAIWREDFEMEHSGCERIKDEFFNQLYIESCMEEDALILVGIVIVKEMDWHQVNDLVETARHQKLVQDIQSLASSGTLSDFKFIVEGRELEVHKAILAARSPVFERMFLGSFREATATELEVKHVSADTFEEFLYFIYAGNLRNKDFPIEELITVADRYEVLDLMKFCELKLIKNVNDDNAERIFRLAQNIHLPNSELKKISFEMLQMKFKRWSISMPDKFMYSPEKVYYSLELKKKLEDIFAVDSETEGTSDDNNDGALTESIPTLSSIETSSAQSIFSLPYSIRSVVTDSVQSIDEDISIL